MSFDETFETIQLLIGEFAERLETPETNRIDAYMNNSQDLVTAAAALRVKRLGNLLAITGLDPGVGSEKLETLYHFSAGAIIITLRFHLPKDSPEISTLCEIIPSAEPFERELSEMFGIKINGIPNPDYLYLPDDWVAGNYPLRKDFDYGTLTNQ